MAKTLLKEGVEVNFLNGELGGSSEDEDMVSGTAVQMGDKVFRCAQYRPF